MTVLVQHLAKSLRWKMEVQTLEDGLLNPSKTWANMNMLSSKMLNKAESRMASSHYINNDEPWTKFHMVSVRRVIRPLLKQFQVRILMQLQ